MQVSISLYRQDISTGHKLTSQKGPDHRAQRGDDLCASILQGMPSDAHLLESWTIPIPSSGVDGGFVGAVCWMKLTSHWVCMGVGGWGGGGQESSLSMGWCLRMVVSSERSFNGSPWIPL